MLFHPLLNNVLVRRILSAAVGLPILIVFVWLGSYWLAVLVALIVLLASREFYGLLKRVGLSPHARLGYAWGACIIAIAAIDSGVWIWIVVIGIATIALLGSLRRSSMTWVLDIVGTTLGSLYIAGSLSAVLIIRQGDQGIKWLLLALFVTFATDIGAYLAGKTWGRHFMVPSISPSKTWEGLAGGLILGTATCLLLNSFMSLPIENGGAIILGIVIVLISQLGDLIESKVKRLAKVKDSGNIIPGHGGLLDRLDSLVLVFPLVYYVS